MKGLTSRTLVEHTLSLSKKEYSSKELTLAYLDEIESKNPSLNAYVTITAEAALESAQLSDQRRAKGETISEIDGIPFAAKDNISTKGILTTCSSKILEGYIPPYDAHVIQLLNKKGAVLLGKTNLDEFAMGVSTETSRYGATLNPLDTRFVAGGSSGGSAAAVAANMAAFSLGSDTGGSVRQPAAFCGLVGMRGTYGCVSRYGLISFAPSMDQIGPITKTVADNALIMRHLLEKDEKDETSIDNPCASLLENLGRDITGKKIAVLKNGLLPSVSPSVQRAMNKTVETLEHLGAQIVEVSIPHARDAYAAYFVISCAEASSNLARFDGVRYGYRTKDFSSLDELYKSSRAAGFGSEAKRRILFGTLTLSSEYKNDFYKKAAGMRAVISGELNDALKSADALLLPTAPSEAYALGEAQKIGFEAGIDDIFCALASLAGLPAVSLPYSHDGKMPVGIQLVGKSFSENILYGITHALENELSGGGINV